MKLLLDACVWGKACEELRRAGHDVVWAGDLEAGLSDASIIAQAYAEARILVTLDKDFGELAVLGGAPHCGIVRLVNIAARLQARVCIDVLETHGAELQRGAIVTAEPGRLRIRQPE